MKPIIAITSAVEESDGVNRVQLNRSYIGAVQGVGGIPIVLPVTSRTGELGEVLALIDGVLLSGGIDVNPSLFGEEPHPKIGSVNLDWDNHDIEVARICLAIGIPILGICRGCQTMNVAAGGSLYQDISSQIPNAIKHSLKTPRWQPGHNITIYKDSLLYRIMASEVLSVNSFHHQSIARVAQVFRATAWSVDGVVEAIESPSHRFALGVQWHPEGMWERYEVQKNIFSALVVAADEYRAGRRVDA